MTQFHNELKETTLRRFGPEDPAFSGMYPIGNCPIGLQEPMVTIPTINEIIKLN